MCTYIRLCFLHTQCVCVCVYREKPFGNFLNLSSSPLTNLKRVEERDDSYRISVKFTWEKNTSKNNMGSK